MPKQDDMNCAVCGGSLKDEDGYAQFAKEVALLSPSPARERVEKLFGKFKFRICHICYLVSLGVKPLKNTPKQGSQKVQ